MRVALRLARAETGTSVNNWLLMPVSDLPDWCEAVKDENKILQAELEKSKRRKS